MTAFPKRAMMWRAGLVTAALTTFGTTLAIGPAAPVQPVSRQGALPLTAAPVLQAQPRSRGEAEADNPPTTLFVSDLSVSVYAQYVQSVPAPPTV